MDLEEWYHTCWVEEWVEPRRRPRLVEELDQLIPQTLDLLAETGARATFFVLGEVARRLPGRIRELAAAGHEVASHGDLHLRVERWPPAVFARQARDAKTFLEDSVGMPVTGYRAPEWSMRHAWNPRLRALAEAGFVYDSSLSPCWGAGSRDNPAFPHVLQWRDGVRLAEYPPLVFAGPARLPACGWTGRMAPTAWIVGAARRQALQGGMPVMTFHPWELVDRPVPGELFGLARLFHNAGRTGYRLRLKGLLGRLPWVSIGEAAAGRSSVLVESDQNRGRWVPEDPA